MSGNVRPVRSREGMVMSGSEMLNCKSGIESTGSERTGSCQLGIVNPERSIVGRERDGSEIDSRLRSGSEISKLIFPRSIEGKLKLGRSMAGKIRSGNEMIGKSNPVIPKSGMLMEGRSIVGREIEGSSRSGSHRSGRSIVGSVKLGKLRSGMLKPPSRRTFWFMAMVMPCPSMRIISPKP